MEAHPISATTRFAAVADDAVIVTVPVCAAVAPLKTNDVGAKVQLRLASVLVQPIVTVPWNPSVGVTVTGTVPLPPAFSVRLLCPAVSA